MFGAHQHLIPPNEYTSAPFPFSQTCFNRPGSQNADPKNQVKHRTRFPFSAKEDQLLMQLVKQFGTDDKINWYIIAMHIEGRSARQCRERYQLFLCDGIKRKEKWTKEEDEVLLNKYSVLGPRWKKMEQFFQGRTSYSIKNRFISLIKQKNKNELNKTQNTSIPPPPITVKRYCLPLKFKNFVPKTPETNNKE